MVDLDDAGVREPGTDRSPVAELAPPGGWAVGVRLAEVHLGGVRCPHGREQHLVGTGHPGHGAVPAAARPDVPRPRSSRPGSPMAATVGAEAVGAASLTMRCTSRCFHRSTGFVRCRPAWSKPMACRVFEQLRVVSRPDLDEVEAFGWRDRGQPVQAEVRRLGIVVGPAAYDVLQVAERALSIDRRTPWVRLPEDVVEHLERQRTLVAGLDDGVGESHQVEVALAGKQPVVPAPGERVQAQGRGVGQLAEEDLLSRNLRNAIERGRRGEQVEAVQAQPDVGVVDGLDDLPRLLVGRHVLAPGERLVGDADAVPLGQVTECTQLGRDDVEVRPGRRGHVRAQQHARGAQSPGELELALGAPHVLGEEVLVDSLEVPEGLEEVDREEPLLAELADLLGAQEAPEQVALEDLDPVEARLGDGVDLGLEAPAQGHGGDAGQRHGEVQSSDLRV